MTSKIIYHDFSNIETGCNTPPAPALAKACRMINATLNNLCLFLCGICCGIGILALLLVATAW